MGWLKILVKVTIFASLAGIAAITGYYFYIKDELPSEESIRDVRLQIPMKVYTVDGELISQFGEKRRTPLLYKEIPQELIDAIIATEDARFYQHFGFDPIGIVRAAFVLLSTGRKAQGASTITQQLARNVFLTFEKTWIRKIKELYIAIHLEQILTKKEILALYLNKSFFGNRAYGIGAAAQVYYNKPISELTLAQLAMIAGLPKAPSAYNPLRNPEKAKWRRNVVLGRMLATGVIDQATYQQAKNEPITAKRYGVNIEAPAPYVAEEVRKLMVEKYGVEHAYTAGLQIFTTIKATAQQAAQEAVLNNIHAYDERHGYRGPVRYLWDEHTVDSTTDANASWDMNRIQTHLSKFKNYGELEPAVVTNVTERSIYVQLREQKIEVIDWSGLSWARPYINENEQGPDPKVASDILSPGAQIWIRPASENNYRLSQIPKVSGSLVAMDPRNGDILALVGGYSFQQNQFNRITQAKRQVGSNIKPFLYSAALDNQFTLASLINDAPINKWDKNLGTAWRPENSPAIYDGPMRVRRGLAQSKNVMAVRLIRAVGVDATVDHLTQFGFDKSDLPANESLSLGSAALTPMSLITGMSAFANGGYLVQSNLIEKVLDVSGATVLQPTKLTATEPDQQDAQLVPEQMPAPRIISKENAFLVAEAMNSAIQGGGVWSKGNGWNGTAWRALSLKRKDLSGKTGTTNKAVDTWFTGFNPNIIATTWFGFDDPNQPLGSTRYNTNLGDNQLFGAEAGAKTALPAWVNFMAKVLPEVPVVHREIPEGVISVRIDRQTGLLSRKTDHTSRWEYFIKGTEPTKYAENSRPVTLDDEQDLIEEEQGIF